MLPKARWKPLVMKLRVEVGIYDVAKFDELAAPIEAKHSAPWLRKKQLADGVEEVHVVDLEQRLERPATPQEMEEGIVAQTIDEYNQRKTA